MRTEQQILPPSSRQNIFLLFSLVFPTDGKPSMIHSELKGAFQSSNPLYPYLLSLSLCWLHICFSLLFKTLFFFCKHTLFLKFFDYHFFLNFFSLLASFLFFLSLIFSFFVSFFFLLFSNFVLLNFLSFFHSFFLFASFLITFFSGDLVFCIYCQLSFFYLFVYLSVLFVCASSNLSNSIYMNTVRVPAYCT
jgi:hypothetical protein